MYWESQGPLDGPPVLFLEGYTGQLIGWREEFCAMLTGKGLRVLRMDNRDIGLSRIEPEGAQYSIADMADDVRDVIDCAGIDKATIVGQSMGGLIAQHVALNHPDRVAGLILVRPAWALEPAPENMGSIREVAELIKFHPLQEARTIFEASKTAARLRREAPDNLVSLHGYFDRPDTSAFAEVLADIASDGTGVSKAEAARLEMPTLVIGNRMDAVHPMATAQSLANAISSASFIEVPAKATDVTAHSAAVRGAIRHFLSTQFNHRSLAS